MYLFDGRAVRRWLPLSRTWRKGLPHSRIRLICCQWQVWLDWRREKIKPFQDLGRWHMSGVIPHHVYLLTLSVFLKSLLYDCYIVEMLNT